MIYIRPRSAWSPQYSDGDTTITGLAEDVYAHHTVTAQLSPFASEADEAAQMRVIEAIGHQRFATEEAPNFGIPYNVLIFPSGRAWQGVSFHRRGAHTDGMNSSVRSLTFVGNYETHAPTDAQLRTAQAIYHEGKGKWWVANASLYGHRDLKSTLCPGQYVYDQLQFIRTLPKEDDMPSAKEVADAVWDEELPVPPNLVDRFGERISMRRAVWATLSRAEATLDAIEKHGEGS